jgi:DNA polymerase-1
MIVSKFNYSDALEEISLENAAAVDTETTGLYPYLGDRVFSLIVTTKKASYYFNFNSSPDHLGNIIDEVYILEREKVISDILFILPKFERVYIHNAKFDMHQLIESSDAALVDILLKANLFCTQATARLVRNDLMSYALESLAPFVGENKDKTVDKYIDEHKLYTLVDEGKKEPKKNKHFDKVPFGIIAPYGLKDGEVCFKLGEYIHYRLNKFNEEQLAAGFIGNADLVASEMQLTKTLFKMERIGVKTSKKYCLEALDAYREDIKKASKDFYDLTGLAFSDSRKILVPAFNKLNLDFPKTEKGNPSFTDDILTAIDNPIANIIKSHRGAYKAAFTYYGNFLNLSDSNDVLHTNLKQGGTTTGRMSCSEPNLQNVPKRKDGEKYKARASFIPREGYFFAMLDYDQMEYRLFMDYAEEMELIGKVLSGLDVHEATAEMVGVNRDLAKTINFSLLYGSGITALAETLGVSISQAKDYKNNYFRNLQNVKETTGAIIATAEKRGYIFNLKGRRCYIPKKLAYKAPNYLIQGGCGDIVKAAMNEIDLYLSSKKSRMLLQIHDEILFEISLDEYEIIDDLKNIMSNAYKHKYLPLTVGADFSFNNWHDKKSVDDEFFTNFK